MTEGPFPAGPCIVRRLGADFTKLLLGIHYLKQLNLYSAAGIEQRSESDSICNVAGSISASSNITCTPNLRAVPLWRRRLAAER